MRLEEQIRELERQKSGEIALLKRHTTRATHGIRRSLSPERVIRKHMGAALIAAVVAGMLIAPGPKYARPSGRNARGSRWMGMLSKFVPGLDRFMPQEPAPNRIIP